MNKQHITTALARMREQSKKRKFRQSVELYVNFKGLDFSKNDNKIDMQVPLPHATGKAEAKILVFAKDPDFAAQAKEKASRVILEKEIAKINKKDAVKLADEYDLVLAEGAAMLSVGKHLGPVLAPKGKMPRLIPAHASAIEEALKQLKGSLRVSNKKGKAMPMVHCLVGHEQFKDDALADNILAIYKALLARLPGKQQNIKSAIVKLTMGAPVRITDEVKK